MSAKESTILFPVPANAVWEKLREIVHAELVKLQKGATAPLEFNVPGLTVKPVYSAQELCDLLSVTRQTLWEWNKEGILKPKKVKSRVYYLWTDVEKLFGVKG
ncbi:MAG TPA: helix-turn-helix domain-containing protein [Flavipsychrobacter sp.]|nr:helix-turn-helix domain-containing protein [Flavipsychrobacter sp.]